MVFEVPPFAWCLALSIALHLPIVVMEPEQETVFVEYDDCIRDPAGRCRFELPDIEDEPDPEPFVLHPEPRDPQLAREMAIEAARVGGLFPRELRNRPVEVVTRPPPPTDELDGPYVDGGLDRRVVRRFVRFHAHEIERCNHELDRIPIGIELHIRPGGNVSDARVTADEEKVAICVENTVRQIQFPPSAEGTRAISWVTLRPRVERHHGTTSTDAAVLVR